jgi:hypothetical protein|tara:strand:- start:533 stop:865 length:333 start_codon:yes stop_codon:yes gene_type:complete
MAKLLNTRLPIANGSVSPEIFNRLVRIIEINLGAFDPVDTEQFTTEERDESNFNAGTIIFNTTTNSLQVFDGVGFTNLSDPFAIITVNNDKIRFSDFMTAELGVVSVTIS